MDVNTNSTQGGGGHETRTRSTSHVAQREVVEAVHNTRRRYALYYLYKHDGTADLKELVEQVAAWEHCPADDPVPTDKRRSVYASLHQTHLPDLEERELIRWDRETNQVECRLDDAMWDLALANDPRMTIRWYRVFPLVAALSLVAMGLTWAGIGPLAGVSAVTVGLAVSVVFAVLSVAYWYDVYRWRRRRDGMPPDFTISSDSAVHSRQSDGEDEVDDER